MSVLYITEFAAVGGASNFPVSAAQQLPLAEQVVTIGAGSLASSAFNANTTLVRLHCDASSACSFEFGASPTATALKARLSANQTEYFSVPPNSGWKVAVIQNS